MSRDGNGVYSKPAGTTAVSGTTIESSKFNTLIDDIAADLNLDRPVAAGGTGASTAADARTNLGVAIGSDVQEHGDVLDDLNALGANAADGEFLVGTGAGALDWESGATARTSMGVGTTDSPQFAGINDGTTTVATPYITGGSAKAWVRGTSAAVVSNSLNVSSGTDHTTGTYSYSLTSAFSANDFSQPCTAYAAFRRMSTFDSNNASASAMAVVLADSAGTLTDHDHVLTAHGDLA